MNTAQISGDETRIGGLFIEIGKTLGRVSLPSEGPVSHSISLFLSLSVTNDLRDVLLFVCSDGRKSGLEIAPH